MTKMLGADFAQKLIDAGLGGRAFSWSPDGTLSFDEKVSANDRNAIQAFVDGYKYDPSADLIEHARMQFIKKQFVPLDINLGGGRSLNLWPNDHGMIVLALAAIAARDDDDFTLQWVGLAGGAPATLSADGIKAVAAALAAHLQKAGAIYADVVGKINAKKITSNSQIDTAFSK